MKCELTSPRHNHLQLDAHTMKQIALIGNYRRMSVCLSRTLTSELEHCPHVPYDNAL